MSIFRDGSKMTAWLTVAYMIVLIMCAAVLAAEGMELSKLDVIISNQPAS